MTVSRFLVEIHHDPQFPDWTSVAERLEPWITAHLTAAAGPIAVVVRPLSDVVDQLGDDDLLPALAAIRDRITARTDEILTSPAGQALLAAALGVPLLRPVPDLPEPF